MIGLLLGMVRIAAARGLDEDGVHYRSGYMIAPDRAAARALSTVHIWGPVNVFVMAYLGAGAWFYTGDHRPTRGRPRAPAARARRRAPGRGGDGRRRAGPGQRKRLCGRSPSAMRGGLVAGTVVKQWRAGRPGAAPAPAARRGRKPVRDRGSEYDVRNLPEAPRPADPCRAPPRLPAHGADRARGAGADGRHRLDPAVPRRAREPAR